jgi:hypothetical protein
VPLPFLVGSYSLLRFVRLRKVTCARRPERHYALLFFLPRQNFQHWPIPNRRHRTRSRPKKDTALKGVLRKERGGRSADHRNAGWQLVLQRVEELGRMPRAGIGRRTAGFRFALIFAYYRRTSAGRGTNAGQRYHAPDGSAQHSQRHRRLRGCRRTAAAPGLISKLINMSVASIAFRPEDYLRSPAR